MNNNDTNMNGINQENSFNPNGLQNNPTPTNVNMGVNSLEGMSLGSVDQSINVSTQMPSSDSNEASSVNTGASLSSTVDEGVTFSIPNIEPITSTASTSTVDMNMGTNSVAQSTNAEIPIAQVNTGASFNTSNVGGINNNISTITGNSSMNSSQPFVNAENTGSSMNESMVSSQAMNFQPEVASMNMNASTNSDTNMEMTQNSFSNNPMPTSSNLDSGTPNLFGATPSPGMNSNIGGINNNINNSILGSVPTPPVMTDFNNNPNPKKKGLPKSIIILIVIVLIVLIGMGIYFVLNKTGLSKAKGSIIINDPVIMPLGKALSTNVSDYATISGFDSTVCSLDLSKVDIKKMGSYDFTVTCGTTSKSGKIVLQDKEAPIVITKEVAVVPGSSVVLEDFVVSCTDDSNCSYELGDNSKTLDEMTAEVGVYEFDLVVSDDYNNRTTVKLKLNVTNDAPVKYMYCTPTATDETDMNASLETSYRYGINNDDALSQTQKILTYTFQTAEDYDKAKEEFATDSSNVIFNDEELIITLTSNMTEEELSSEFNVSPFPTNYDDLKEFHLNQGISCKNR